MGDEKRLDGVPPRGRVSVRRARVRGCERLDGAPPRGRVGVRDWSKVRARRNDCPVVRTGCEILRDDSGLRKIDRSKLWLQPR